MDVDETVRLVDLGTDKANDLFAQFFIESMAEMAADMWNDGNEQPIPTAEDAKEQAAGYALDMFNEWRDAIVKKIREMDVKVDYRLELKKIKFGDVDPNE